MKTLFTEKDLAFKSETPAELIEMALEWTETAKPGLRNELSKMIQKCRHDGLQKSKKSSFIAGFDKKRGEYNLFIKDQYDPAVQMAMLFDLLTEPFVNEENEVVVHDRVQMIDGYLSIIEKNEDLKLGDEKSKLKTYTGEFVKLLSIYSEDDLMSEEEITRLSEKIDLSFYKPISDIIESILNRLISGSMPVEIGSEEDQKN